MSDVLYPKRIEDRIHIQNFKYADPEDLFHVHDLFVLLYMLIVKKPDEQKDRYTRLLLCTALELYGWKDTPLFATLQNPQSTQEEIKASRRLRYNEARETEELTAINIYWSYHDTLLKVPFAWYRPHIGVGAQRMRQAPP